jgi:MFS family permease
VAGVTGAEGRHADGLWSAPHRALTLGLVLTISLTAFEILAVATIMPIVARELGGLDLYGWAFSAFFLGSLLGTVIVGGILDRRGLTGSFLGSLLLFAAGLVLAGVASSMPMLIVARFVQGLGGGALTPVANTAIGRGLPERLRPPMYALLSTAWILPAVMGPAAAGVIGEAFGWRIVFLGLLPLLVVAGVLARGALERLGAGAAPPGTVAGGQARRIGLAVVVTIGAGLVTAGLSSGAPASIGGAEIPGPVVVLATVVGGLLLVAIAFQRLTPPGTLRLARGLPAAILLRGVLNVGFYSLDAYVALTLINWRGLPASLAGLALASGSLAWTVGSWTQARWALRLGYPFFVRSGFALLAVGVTAFALALDRQIPVVVSFAAFTVAGLGMGLAFAPQSLIVLHEAAPEEQGSATSALSLADLLGTALGTGFSGAILSAGLRGGATTGDALLPAFLVGAGAAALGALLSGRLRTDGTHATLR